ncbi:MAG: hypothetical protein U0871_12975 [Gemmataceae bacterium]
MSHGASAEEIAAQLSEELSGRDDVVVITSPVWSPNVRTPAVVVCVQQAFDSDAWDDTFDLLERLPVAEVFWIDATERRVNWYVACQGRLRPIRFKWKHPNPKLGGYLEFLADGRVGVFVPPHVVYKARYHGDEWPL